MFVLYELLTGRNHSQSSLWIKNPDTEKYGVIETNMSGIWSDKALDFEPFQVDKRMSTLSFIELFTQTELVNILEAAKVNTVVELFVFKMKQAEFIDLSYQPTIDGINSLVGGGLISEARALEVLNG